MVRPFTGQLKEARENKGLTQEQLANEVSVSRSTVSHWETGRKDPEKEFLDRLERFPEGTPCYIPFLFGYRAGTRLGETFALCWNDIDFENNRIDINKQVQWYPERKQWRMVPPKYDSRREIDILTVLQIRMYPILMQKILIYQILIFSHARREKTFAFAQKPASFSSVRRLYKCEKEVVITWKLSRALTILKTLRRS